MNFTKGGKNKQKIQNEKTKKKRNEKNTTKLKWYELRMKIIDIYFFSALWGLLDYLSLLDSQ